LVGKISEKQLSEIWRRQAFESRNLKTENGVSITVVYPGRINDHRGGDFCDAVIGLGGRTVTGDVELHVNSKDWEMHGHDHDFNYNRVVLHVVFRNNSSLLTGRQDGGKIPVLALEKTVEQVVSEPTRTPMNNRPCQNKVHRDGVKAVAGILDRAGEARFQEKTDRIKAELATNEAGQILYRGIMEVLGYSQNREPFLRLAREMPLAVLESVSAENITDDECFSRIYNQLLLTAGLSRGLTPETDRKKSGSDIISGIQPDYGWQRYHLRPNNSPILRINAIARLLVRYRHNGLLTGLLERVNEAPLNKSDQYFEKALGISSEEQDSLYRFPRSSGLTPLGKGRARDITVNILLPFAYAFGQIRKIRGLRRKSTAIYHGHSRLDDNCIERHMTEQLALPKGIVDNARRQQGLLYIYVRYCSRGLCTACGLG
jgi:hypothetical protein